MEQDDRYVETLRAMWNEMKALNGRIDETNSRLDARIDETNGRLDARIDETNSRIDRFRGEVIAHIAQSEIRLSTMILDLTNEMKAVNAEMKQGRRDRQRIDNLETRVDALEKKR